MEFLRQIGRKKVKKVIDLLIKRPYNNIIITI